MALSLYRRHRRDCEAGHAEDLLTSEFETQKGLPPLRVPNRFWLDQLTVADMDAFYASWKDGLRAKAKKLDSSGISRNLATNADGLPRISQTTLCPLLVVA